MRHPDLSAEQRLAAASASGAVELLAFGRLAHAPLKEAVAELRAITRDPVVLGHVLGSCRVYADDDPRYGRAIEMLRAAGVDESAAAAKETWLRSRREERGALLP